MNLHMDTHESRIRTAIRVLTWISASIIAVAAVLIVLGIVVGPCSHPLSFTWRTAPAMTTGGQKYRAINFWCLCTYNPNQLTGMPQSRGSALYLVEVICVPAFSKETGPDGLPVAMMFEPRISVPAGLPIAWALAALAAGLPVLFVCWRVRRGAGRGFPVTANE